MRPLRSVFDTISSSSPRRCSTPVGRITRVIVDESSRRANAPHEWNSHPPKGLRQKMLIRCDRGNPRVHLTAPYHYLGASLAVCCYRRRAMRNYIVAPSTQGANSAPPKSKLSLLVGCPDAVLRMRSKMRWPHCWTLSSPSRMVPQLTSMSSSMRLYMDVLVASLIEGAGLQPNTLPRPVMKQTRLLPPATCPVAATGS